MTESEERTMTTRHVSAATVYRSWLFLYRAELWDQNGLTITYGRSHQSALTRAHIKSRRSAR